VEVTAALSSSADSALCSAHNALLLENRLLGEAIDELLTRESQSSAVAAHRHVFTTEAATQTDTLPKASSEEFLMEEVHQLKLALKKAEAECEAHRREKEALQARFSAVDAQRWALLEQCRGWRESCLPERDGSVTSKPAFQQAQQPRRPSENRSSVTPPLPEPLYPEQSPLRELERFGSATSDPFSLLHHDGDGDERAEQPRRPTPICVDFSPSASPVESRGNAARQGTRKNNKSCNDDSYVIRMPQQRSQRDVEMSLRRVSPACSSRARARSSPSSSGKKKHGSCISGCSPVASSKSPSALGDSSSSRRQDLRQVSFAETDRHRDAFEAQSLGDMRRLAEVELRLELEQNGIDTDSMLFIEDDFAEHL